MTYENYLGFFSWGLLKNGPNPARKAANHCLGGWEGRRDLQTLWGLMKSRLLRFVADYAKELSDQEFLDLTIAIVLIQNSKTGAITFGMEMVGIIQRSRTDRSSHSS